jgi:hypothetical protein
MYGVAYLVKNLCEVEVIWQIFLLNNGHDGDFEIANVYRVAIVFKI